MNLNLNLNYTLDGKVKHETTWNIFEKDLKSS